MPRSATRMLSAPTPLGATLAPATPASMAPGPLATTTTSALVKDKATTVTSMPIALTLLGPSFALVIPGSLETVPLALITMNVRDRTEGISATLSLGYAPTPRDRTLVLVLQGTPATV